MTTPEEPNNEGRVWFRPNAEAPWQDLGLVRPVSIGGIPVPRDGSDPVQISMRNVEESMRRMDESMARLAEMLRDLPRFEVPRGGIRFGLYVKPDPRRGEDAYVSDILPGARVYVLEDVFTVDRVDMDAPLPTVWLKELPTSPLYFEQYDTIPLANETED